jgi:hypothetical protein
MPEMPLSELLRSLQGQPRDKIFGLSESNSRKWIIEPILQALKWNVNLWSSDKEVIEEFPIGTRRVDYCLQIANENKIFIEVKKPTESLLHHQSQLFNYVNSGDVKMAILTNCIDWWLYHPAIGGQWRDRPFHKMNLLTEKTDDLVKNFDTYMSRSNILSGIAFDDAKIALKIQKNTILVEEALPRAWNKILFQDDTLIGLLSETVTQAEGMAPSYSEIKIFLETKRILYNPIEDKESKKNERKFDLSHRPERHKSRSIVNQENGTFYQRILQEDFSGNFTTAPGYRVIFQCETDIVFFGGYGKENDNWWYRVAKKQWELLQHNKRKATLCFTNSAENISYIIPVSDVLERIETSGWNRNYLEVNINSIRHKWNELEWDINRYCKKYSPK